MSFIADKQTLDDLSLLGKYNPYSVFSLFNQVKTRGGQKLLDHMFNHPLTDPAQINNRSAAFRYFSDHHATFPFEEKALGSMEAYLDEGCSSNFPMALWHMSRKKFTELTVKDDTLSLQLESIEAGIGVLNTSAALLHQLEKEGRDKNSPWEKWATIAREITADPRLKHLGAGKRSFLQNTRLHFLLAYVFRDQLLTLLELTYELEVYITVSAVGREKGFLLCQRLAKSTK